jgi:dTDP-4-amino-4,6-dideoxygalactose transaminase
MFKVRISDQALGGIAGVFRSGMLGEGPKVAEFKQHMEKYLGCRNFLPLSSGTAALALALRLVGVEGGEVITTPFTMIATNTSIKAAGADPVFADIEENNMNIYYASVANRITSRTRAIMCVHVAGIPCEMEKLRALGLPIISDAAHAIGTYYKRNHIVHWADYTCFSFQSIKQLTTGDGGAIVVKDDKQFERAERLKWFGMTRNVPEGKTRLQHQMTADVPEWGYKYHMNDIAAAIGLANLPGLDESLKVASSNALYYHENLKNVKGLTLPTIPLSKPAWFAYPVFVEDRERFMAKMLERKIETTPMWRRNDFYSTFPQMKPSNLPNMDRRQDHIVFLPVGWWVTMADMYHIVECIKEGW